MAYTLLSQKLIASRLGSSSSVLDLKTAQWTLDNYNVGSLYSGNTIVADPLCYGVYFYFDGPHTNNGSSGISQWQCTLKRNTSPVTTYQVLKIIVPEGYGLPTSSGLTTNKNAFFGISVSAKSASNLVFEFVVNVVGSSAPVTTTINVSNTTWMATGGRVYVPISTSGTVSSPGYYAASTTYTNQAKTFLADGVVASDVDAIYQTHILRT